jgi:hypothetical protein
MISLRRQLDQQNNGDDYYYAANDDDSIDDAVQEATDDAVQQQQTDDSSSNGNSSSGGSIRVTNCITFTVEPQDDQFNAMITKNTNINIPTSYIPEESFVFFGHQTGNDNAENDAEQHYNTNNLGNTYMINVKEWVQAFVGQGGESCQSLANYQSDVFGNNNSDDDLSSLLENIFMGPLCHPTNFGITVGVFLDSDCTIYAPELSQQLQQYLYYNEDGEPDQDLMDAVYSTTALNAYYQTEYNCNNNNNDNDNDVCSIIFENAVDQETCQTMDGSSGESSSSSNTYSLSPGTFTNWFRYGDPHNYYHLSQTDLQDPTSTCNAIDTALSSSSNRYYTFADILWTLEQENGDTAATLEHYNQEILSPMEKLVATIGAVILAMIGIYCCVVTTRRMDRARRRAKRRHMQQLMTTSPTDDESTSIIYELGRTFTVASSSSSSDDSGNGSKKEPLLVVDNESTTDITNGSTKYPIAASSSSYTYAPRLEQGNGSTVLQQGSDQHLKIMSIVPEHSRNNNNNNRAKSSSSKARKSKIPFMRWIQFGERPDEDVFDGITTISESATFEDPFVGIIADNVKRSDRKQQQKGHHDDNDSLFQGVTSD